MNVAASTETRMCGNVWLNCSISCPWLQSLKISSSVSMEDFLPASKLWTTSELWKDSRKSLMKDPCATCSGPILMTGLAGEWILEALDTLLVKTLLNNLTTQTIWRWLHVLISWWWRYSLKYSGLHEHSQQECFNNLLSSKLLLQMWKHGRYHGCWWEPETDLHPVWSRSQERQWGSKEESAWLFPMILHFIVLIIKIDFFLLSVRKITELLFEFLSKQLKMSRFNDFLLLLILLIESKWLRLSLPYEHRKTQWGFQLAASKISDYRHL